MGGEDPLGEFGRGVGRIAVHPGVDDRGLEPQPALDDRIARRAVQQGGALGGGVGA